MHPKSGWSIVFSVDGSALTPPWFLTVVFALALLLALLPGRWGLLGLLFVFVYSGSYINGEGVEAFPHWAFNYNPGFSFFLWLSYVLAGGTVLTAVAEFWLRAHHRGRRPAPA